MLRFELLNFISTLGRGDTRAVRKSNFAHITTKTWAYSGVFGFSRQQFWEKTAPTPTQITF
jgi:hypothetical protein